MPWREGFCTQARATLTTGRRHRPLAAAGLPRTGTAGCGRPVACVAAGSGRAACEVVLWSSAQRGV